MSFASNDVVIMPVSSVGCLDRWIAYNVFTRTSLGISSKIITLLGGIRDFSPNELFICWEIAYFSNEKGLMADPSRFYRDQSKWQKKELNIDEVIEKLKQQYIIIEDELEYRSRFKDKKSILDNVNFGNFHQQHGQNMLINRVGDPAHWWMCQKFDPSFLNVSKNTLYFTVQEQYLRNYFRKRLAKGMKILDVGCGTGIYSNILASLGAEVIGIDPSEKYLQVARDNAVPNTQFIKMNPGDKGGMEALSADFFDFVLMSDSLLFYYRPFYPGQEADINILLKEIFRVLKRGGHFLSMEPHGSFYLTPWLGNESYPFTVISEYKNKKYGISPPLEWTASHLTKTGFVITDIAEPEPVSCQNEVEIRAHQFAQVFPLWQVIEARKI